MLTISWSIRLAGVALIGLCLGAPGGCRPEDAPSSQTPPPTASPSATLHPSQTAEPRATGTSGVPDQNLNQYKIQSQLRQQLSNQLRGRTTVRVVIKTKAPPTEDQLAVLRVKGASIVSVSGNWIDATTALSALPGLADLDFVTEIGPPGKGQAD